MITVQVRAHYTLLEPVLSDEEGIVVALPAGFGGLPRSAGRGRGILMGEDEVFPVTVGARRTIRDAGLEGSAMNGPVILKLDVRVTLAAGGGHIDGADAGVRIGGSLQVVYTVAIRTGCRRRYPSRCTLTVDG